MAEAFAVARMDWRRIDLVAMPRLNATNICSREMIGQKTDAHVAAVTI
jgi:hypothetical protein